MYELSTTWWHMLILQTNITLNILLHSRINPKLSACSYFHGLCYLTSKHMAPPGNRVLVHSHYDKRKSWDLNAEHGWCVGPSLNHYRFVWCYIPRTRSTIDSDAIEFFSRAIPFPAVSLTDYLKQSATDIVSIIKNQHSTTFPALQSGNDVTIALHVISDLPNRLDKIPYVKTLSDAKLPRAQEPPKISRLLIV